MRVPDGEFFRKLPNLEKIIKFYTYINVIHVKNENCKFLKNLCTDFLVAFQLKLLGCLLCFPQNKENSPCRNLETPSRSQVGSTNKPSISIGSCLSNNIWVLKESSICSVTLQVFIIHLIPSAINKNLVLRIHKNDNEMTFIGSDKSNMIVLLI